MKLKSLKKNIKEYLFNFNILKHVFVIFEKKENINIQKVNIKFISVDSFPKQIFNKLKNIEFNKIKFPNKIKSFFLLQDLLKYFVFLKKNNFTSNIFLIKINFFFIKELLEVFFRIFLENENLLIFHFFSFFFLRHKVFMSI